MINQEEITEVSEVEIENPVDFGISGEKEVGTLTIFKLLLPRIRTPDFAIWISSLIASISGVTISSKICMYVCSCCSLGFVACCCFIPLMNLTIAHSEYYGDITMSWTVFFCVLITMLPIVSGIDDLFFSLLTSSFKKLIIVAIKVIEMIGTSLQLGEVFGLDRYGGEYNESMVRQFKLLIDIPKAMIFGSVTLLKCVCGVGCPLCAFCMFVVTFILGGIIGMGHALFYSSFSEGASAAFFVIVTVLCCCSGVCILTVGVSTIYSLITLVMEAPEWISFVLLFVLKHLMRNGRDEIIQPEEEQEGEEGEGEGEETEAPLLERTTTTIDEPCMKMLLEFFYGRKVPSFLTSFGCVTFETGYVPVKMIIHAVLGGHIFFGLAFTLIMAIVFLSYIGNYRTYTTLFLGGTIISLIIFFSSILCFVIISLCGYIVSWISSLVHFGEIYFLGKTNEKNQNIKTIKGIIDIPRYLCISCTSCCKITCGCFIPLSLCGCLFFSAVIVGCISSLFFLNQKDGLVHYGRTVEITFLFAYFSLISIGVTILCFVVVVGADTPDWIVLLYLSSKKWIGSFYEFGTIREPESKLEDEMTDIDDEISKMENENTTTGGEEEEDFDQDDDDEQEEVVERLSPSSSDDDDDDQQTTVKQLQSVVEENDEEKNIQEPLSTSSGEGYE